MNRFAVKRLAAVEIDPDTSNQHELNADALRRELGFSHGRTQGHLSLLFYLSNDESPVVEEGEFTLYDARERHPTRSEYRMYYRTPAFGQLAKPGDLLLLFRDGDSGGLQGVVARCGTAMERQMEESLRIGDGASLRRFLFRKAVKSDSYDAAELVQTLLPFPPRTDLSVATRHHPLYVAAVERAAVPPTRQMALSGREIAEAVWGRGLGADEFVGRGLQAESELYFAIERDVGSQSLKALMDRGAADLDATLSWALKLQQSRKARRGQSLQHHFAFLLDREGIPFTAQGITERGETPDFVIPGLGQYLVPTFPAQRLRMVACKSTVRERWGQILKEAERIPQKYLLTVDPDLTADTIKSMREVELFLFLPLNVLQESYVANPVRQLLGSVGQLLAALRSIL